jgi:Holliday junction DNA helicase RuvA
MIGKLTGIVDEVAEDQVVLDVGGVGYVVHCSAHTLQRLPRVGERTSLAIETQMREDALRLFGFSTAGDRDWFRLLQTVQGVGAKVALGLLGALPSRDLAVAIAQQDRTAVARAPGIGPKLAARIVAELKDKVGALQPGGTVALAPSEAAGSGVTNDAVSALVNLGYGRPQAAAAVAVASQELGENVEASALIRRGLRELSR